MISIIICSVNKEVLKNAVESISATTGVPYEIIIIDNYTADTGICSAYNQGAAKAKYDIFCFMHEDITFETFGWGKKVADHLQSYSAGLIGLAGGTVKSLVPSSWSSSIFASEVSYIQHFKHNNIPARKIVRTSSPENASKSKEVVCIDGFWMCTRRDVFNKYQFDEKTFSGFHGYDIDFCLQLSKEYKVAVIFDVILNHYSEGSFNKAWIKDAILVSNKWKKTLPQAIGKLSEATLLRQHWTTMRNFIDDLIILNYGLPFILKYYLKYSFNKFFYWKHFLHFMKYIFSAYFKKRSGVNNAGSVENPGKLKQIAR